MTSPLPFPYPVSMPIEIVQDVVKRCGAGQLKPWEQKIKDDKGLTCTQLGEAVAAAVEAKTKKFIKPDAPSKELELTAFIYNSLTEQDFKEYASLQKIDRVEVMATGTWKGDPYTEADLDGMVKAFNSLSLKPRLKLGHGSQKIADGLPALGYVSNLWREGKKLVASFIDIPNTLYEIIKNKGYNAVSSEIWFNRIFEGKQWPKVLTAVAFLGDKLPAVETLKDISAMYSLPGNGGELRAYSIEDYKPEIEKPIIPDKEDKKMDEKLIKENEDLKAKNAELVKTVEEKGKETDTFKTELAKKEGEVAKEKRDTWLEKFSTGEEPKIAPVEKPFVSYLMERLDGNYDGIVKLSLEGEDKELTPLEAFQKLFEKRASLSGLFGEIAKGGATEKAKGPLGLDEEIAKYAKEKGKTLAEATEILMQEKLELFKDYGKTE